jgi:hypothetical protein
MLSDERMGLSLMSVRIAHRPMACYWKFFLLHYIQILCQYTLSKANHAYLTYPMLQRQLSHLNGRKLDRLQVEASYIFYLSIRLVLCCERVHSHYFIWLLFVACTILLYNRIHTEGWKLCANRGPVCTLENFQCCGEPCFGGAAILRGTCLPQIPRRARISYYWSNQCFMEG